MISEKEMRDELKSAIAKAGSQKALAKRFGLSEQFICDVIKGRRNVSQSLAIALGYRQVVMFTPLKAIQ